MPTFKNSSNSEKYLPLELIPSSWTQNWKKTRCCLFHAFFGWWASKILFFLFLMREVNRIDSWNRFTTKVICTKKLQLGLTVFTWLGSSKERDGNKLKFLMNWRWKDAFSPLSGLRPFLISCRKNKNHVFSESKLVSPVPQIPGSAPEKGRLVLVITWFRVQFTIKQHE